MAIVSLEYVKRRLGVEDNSQDDYLHELTAAASDIVADRTNRKYSHVIGAVEVGVSSTEFLVAGHGLITGDTVRVDRGDATDGDQVVTVVNKNSFSVPVAGSVSVCGGTIRKHLVINTFSRGGVSVFIGRRPVAEIISVKTSDKPGVLDTTLTTDDYYLVPDIDGYSFCGELIRLNDKEWPVKRPSGRYGKPISLPGTVQVTYVAGTIHTPSDIQEAVANLASAVRDNGGEVPMASESFDYYSYSRQSIEELTQIPESVVATMKRYRLPNI